MRNARTWIVSMTALAMLVASQATAQQVYSMYGRLISTRGENIKIPVIGQNQGNCNFFQRGWTRTTTAAAITGSPAAQTGTMKGYGGMLLATGVVIPQRQGATKDAVGHYGCVEGMGNITATAKGVGKRFTFPQPTAKTTSMGVPGAFFHRPLPLHTIAVEIMNEAKFPQLATSFRIDAPQFSIPNGVTSKGMITDDAPHGVLRTPKVNPTNLAPHRKFMPHAWKGGPASTDNGQTGRAGPNFTWCFGMSGCTKIGGGTGIFGKIMVKYQGGPNRFGGTMSYVISTGTGKSNLALAVAPDAHKTLVLLALGGMGQQATGRGYADKLTDKVKTGPIFAMYGTGDVSVPEIMQVHKLITKVSTQLNPGAMSTMTALVNSNYGFPFTTGTVLVRATGKTPGPAKSPATSTNTAMGLDKTVNGGNGRILTLVAGQMARTTEGSNTPGIVYMPEPGHSFQLLAGALVLVGVAIWRARCRH